MSKSPKFDVLTATAADLRALLERGTLSSVEIVETYLAQIEAHNCQGLNLRAIAAVAPREIALQRAEELDEERKAGRARGPLHGIPVIIKDAIVTGPELGMPTTAGTVAFETAIAKKNAKIVDRLMDAGLIVLGKASMSEYCGSHDLPAGYSASNGQTQSPYIRGGRRKDDGIAGHTSPGGSSSGSGAGVAAGFAPLSVGTDTVGSIVLPANRAALFTLKLPSDSVPMGGVFRLARGWDSLGPMTKGVNDLAHMTEVMQKRVFVGDADLKASDMLRGLRIGAVEFKNWQPISASGSTDEEMEQMKQEYKDAVGKLAELGAIVTHPISFTLGDTHRVDGKGHNAVSAAEGRENFKAFTECFESTPVRTVEELITFNEGNKERAMPEPRASNVELLRWRENTTPPEETAYLVEQLRTKGRAALDNLFKELDVILLPADCMYAAIASSARYPFGTVPLGYLKSVGMPQGLTVGVNQNGEETMIRFMNGFEANFPKRRPPPQLQ